MVKVSVILTTYNSENQIQEVLDSILQQEGCNRLFELELIVIDDCSTDNTSRILLQNDINFLSTERNTGGPNSGRNIALRKCSGDFIMIADHDDVWSPNRLTELLLASSLAPIVSSGFRLNNLTSKRISIRVNISQDNSSHLLFKKNETFISKLTKNKKGQQTYLGSIMFSSNFINLKFEEKYGMIDFDWILKLFHNQNSVEVCKPLYTRFVRNNNLSLNENYRINDYHFSLKTINEYKSLYPRAIKLSKKRINGSMGRYYYLIGNMSAARRYLIRSRFGFKLILYLVTTFVGSRLVKKYFNVFG